MKRFICFFMMLVFCVPSSLAAPAAPEISAPSAVLMEKETGSVIFQKDAHTKRPPASVTKVMTLLLVMEAIDSGKISLDDKITVSEYAAGMGGSQVFLSPGEEISVNDLLKSTIISSGNDSAVALAEYIAGSESGFVDLMNKKAAELGMKDTCFKNCTGLDADGHVTSAYDIALMSRALISHEKIKEYATIWMDSIRDGAFQLSNTNKLIRTYNGITGLKTGSTSIAKFCYSGTAKRGEMELISTILAAPTSKERFSDASKLLDYGFANYSLYIPDEPEKKKLPVILGAKPEISLSLGETPSILVEKINLSKIKTEILVPENIKAPVEKGQKVGSMKIFSEEKVLKEIPIVASESIEKIGLYGIYSRFLSNIFLK